ncbi:hypothetical protein DUI87_26632 [Hirundo rustica rustica]|uniref:Uncharacterized protein n=1 Tax=Hirundo rustica rustica TaxID=333673 RepID=A0A3M0J6R7_HIRRU|nr:hypothetical protein DUI87_26632 [Hirundo rustica rustica]
MLCSIAGTHKGHEVITTKEGHDKQLVKLFDTMTELQECKSDLVTALEKLQEREDQIKINAETLTSELKELFDDTETKLHEKKMMILSDIRSNEEEPLAAIADVRKKMEQKTDQAEQNLQALQKIKKQPDVFLFFKDLKLVTDRVASLDLDTESVEVKEVELDNKMFTWYKTRQKKLMLQLDSLLNDVRDKFTGLNGEEQGEESIIEEEQDINFLNNLFGNFDSPKPRHKGHVKKRPWE